MKPVIEGKPDQPAGDSGCGKYECQLAVLRELDQDVFLLGWVGHVGQEYSNNPAHAELGRGTLETIR